MTVVRKFTDLSNVDFGTLNSSKNNNLVRFDTSSGTYKLVTMKTVKQSRQVLDGNLPDDFVSQIEDEIDAANLDFEGVDGGNFLPPTGF